MCHDIQNHLQIQVHVFGILDVTLCNYQAGLKGQPKHFDVLPNAIRLKIVKLITYRRFVFK